MSTQTPQAESATLKNIVSNEVNELDTIESRIGFIMDTLCPESEWIEDYAATGLYFTLNSINMDLKALHARLSKGWKAS